MPFIGQQPTTGAFLELDSLTASATADYTLQLNGANYEPESVNNLLVSINGVIQGSSTMSLSGSTLTVGATLSSSDVIDFVRVFGNVGTISTPTDGSVTANKIGTGAVDLTTKVTGVLPVANGGTGDSGGVPYIMLDKNGNQTITSGSRTVVTGWTTASSNGLSLVSDSITVDATTAGKYFCNWQCSVNSDGNNIGDFRLSILQEGVRKIGAYNLLLAGSLGANPFDAAWYTANVSGILDLATDDTVTVDVLATAGGTVVVSGGDSESPLSTNFSMFRIGA